MKRKQDQLTKQGKKRADLFKEPGSLARKKSMIHIEYNKETTQWEVARPATRYMETMGVPGVKGARQTFYPEEVFYLYEIGSAIVKDKEGKQLIGTEVLALTLRAVSFPCLMAYREIKRAGFVVVRRRFLPKEPAAKPLTTESRGYFYNQFTSPSTSEQTDNDLVASKKSSPKESYLSLKPFSSAALDAFPTLMNGTIRMVHLATDEALSPTHEPISSRMISPYVLRLTVEGERQKRLSFPLAPRFWPNLEEIASNVTNWSEYRERFKKTLEMNKQRMSYRYNSFHSPSPSPRGRPSPRRGFSRSPFHANMSFTPPPHRPPPTPRAVQQRGIEYDIYKPGTYLHSVVTPPLMRMMVIEASCGNVLPLCSSPEPSIRSIFAIVSDDSVISYIEHSNNPISLEDLKGSLN